jgi:hypothetical protein
MLHHLFSDANQQSRFHRLPTWAHVLFAIVYSSITTVMHADCSFKKELAFAHAEIGIVNIFRDPQSSAIAFASQMQVNTDGAPDSSKGSGSICFSEEVKE